MNTIVERVAYGFLGIIVFTIIGVLVFFAANTAEKNECRQWAEQAATLKAFYITSWQKDQCDAWHIKINAPVK